jgi:hypothetical protein
VPIVPLRLVLVLARGDKLEHACLRSRDDAAAGQRWEVVDGPALARLLAERHAETRDVDQRAGKVEALLRVCEVKLAADGSDAAGRAAGQDGVELRTGARGGHAEEVGQLVAVRDLVPNDLSLMSTTAGPSSSTVSPTMSIGTPSKSTLTCGSSSPRAILLLLIDDAEQLVHGDGVTVSLQAALRLPPIAFRAYCGGRRRDCQR